MCVECDCSTNKKRTLLCSVVCFLCFILNTRPENLVACDRVRFISSWSLQPFKNIHASRSCAGLLKLVKRFFFFVCVYVNPQCKKQVLWTHVLIPSYRLIQLKRDLQYMILKSTSHLHILSVGCLSAYSSSE